MCIPAQAKKSAQTPAQKPNAQPAKSRKPAQAVEIEPKPLWVIIERRLKNEKFDPAFIAEMKRLYEKDRFGEVLRLNVMLFLRRTNYHGVQVTEDAAQNVAKFLDRHAR